MHQQLSYVLCQTVNFGQVPTVPGAEETGCHANATMVLFFSALTMVPWCSKTGMILCPEVFCPGIC